MPKFRVTFVRVQTREWTYEATEPIEAPSLEAAYERADDLARLVPEHAWSEERVTEDAAYAEDAQPLAEPAIALDDVHAALGRIVGGSGTRLQRPSSGE